MFHLRGFYSHNCNFDFDRWLTTSQKVQISRNIVNEKKCAISLLMSAGHRNNCKWPFSNRKKKRKKLLPFKNFQTCNKIGGKEKKFALEFENAEVYVEHKHGTSFKLWYFLFRVLRSVYKSIDSKKKLLCLHLYLVVFKSEVVWLLSNSFNSSVFFVRSILFCTLFFSVKSEFSCMNNLWTAFIIYVYVCAI